MNPWILAMIAYLGLAGITFVPALAALLGKVKLLDGGAGPDDSPVFSEEAKKRLTQNHSRMLGTLGFWKKQAEFYRRFHFHALGWVIPSTVLLPFLAQAVTSDPWSRWLMSVVSALSAILLSFHQWLKVEQNFRAFRLGESAYYDLRRRMLDRPRSFGEDEETQLDAYFAAVEKIRSRIRDAELDNFPGSDIPKIGSGPPV